MYSKVVAVHYSSMLIRKTISFSVSLFFLLPLDVSSLNSKGTILFLHKVIKNYAADESCAALILWPTLKQMFDSLHVN